MSICVCAAPEFRDNPRRGLCGELFLRWAEGRGCRPLVAFFASFFLFLRGGVVDMIRSGHLVFLVRLRRCMDWRKVPDCGADADSKNGGFMVYDPRGSKFTLSWFVFHAASIYVHDIVYSRRRSVLLGAKWVAAMDVGGDVVGSSSGAASLSLGIN